MTKETQTELNDTDFVERRASARHPVIIRVSLYYDRLGLIACKTRDLSIEGMLLDTGRVRLSKNTHVEVVMTDLTLNYNDPIRVQARVNRVHESLAALAFHNLEIGAFRRLKTLLAATTSIA